MTEAEAEFKRTVLAAINNGWYPGPQLLTGRRDLNSRQIRWRKEILLEQGWEYAPNEPRFKWLPPKGKFVMEYRKDHVAVMIP